MGAMTVANLRGDGMASIRLYCGCGHNGTASVERFPAHFEVPDLRWYFRCPWCGERPLQSVPDWPDGTKKGPTSAIAEIGQGTRSPDGKQQKSARI